MSKWGGGGEVFLTDGTYYLGPEPVNGVPATNPAPLEISSNTHLRLSGGATLMRRVNNGGANAATIKNKTYDGLGNENITVSGGTIKTLSTACVGKHLAFQNVDYLRVGDMRILDGIGAWTGTFVDCEYMTLTGLTVITAAPTPHTNEDGIHLMSCRRAVLANLFVVSNDDAISITQDAGAGVAVADMSDIVLSNCFLWSKKVAAVKIQVASGVSYSIRRVRLSNVIAQSGESAAPGGLALWIEDANASGHKISDIDVDGFQFDGTNGANDVFKILGAERVRLHKFTAYQPRYRGVIDRCDDVELSSCVINRPQQSGTQCLAAGTSASCTNVRIHGGIFRATSGGAHALQFGSATTSVSGFEVRGALLEGVPDVPTPPAPGSAFGVFLDSANNGLVANNTIKDFPVYGIFEQTLRSNNNLFIGNRLFNNGTPIVIGTNNSQAIREVAQAGVAPADTGGFRESVDAWDVASSAASPTEMYRFGVQLVNRFRAARKGSITGLAVQTTTGGITGGVTVTVTVYKNTSGVAGAAVGSAGVGTTGYFLSFSSGTNPTPITQAQNVTNFNAGDELFLVYSNTATPGTLVNLRASFEVQI